MITGARLVGPGVVPPVTSIANAGRAVCATPSDTEIAMPLCVPTSPAAGVPQSRPVTVSNCAQAGLPVTEKTSVWPSGSDDLRDEFVGVAGDHAAGRRAADRGRGVGGRETLHGEVERRQFADCLAVGDADQDALVRRQGRGGGVPSSLPVIGLKVAQSGRFSIWKVSVSPSASDGRGRELVGLADLRDCSRHADDLRRIIGRGANSGPSRLSRRRRRRRSPQATATEIRFHMAMFPIKYLVSSKASGAEESDGKAGSSEETGDVRIESTTTAGTGQPRYPGHPSLGPEALRPCLSAGLPLSKTSRPAVCSCRAGQCNIRCGFEAGSVRQSRF